MRDFILGGACAFCIALSAEATRAENQFTAITVSSHDSSGLPVALTFELFEENAAVASSEATLRGRAFSAQEGKEVPISIRASANELPSALDDTFEISGVGGERRAFRVFSYRRDVSSSTLNRVVVLGQTAEETPAVISATDDPTPFLIPAIFIGSQLAFCAATYIQPWIRECPGGYEITVNGGLTGLSCSLDCRP